MGDDHDRRKVLDAARVDMCAAPAPRARTRALLRGARGKARAMKQLARQNLARSSWEVDRKLAIEREREETISSFFLRFFDGEIYFLLFCAGGKEGLAPGATHASLNRTFSGHFHYCLYRMEFSNIFTHASEIQIYYFPQLNEIFSLASSHCLLYWLNLGNKIRSRISF